MPVLEVGNSEPDRAHNMHVAAQKVSSIAGTRTQSTLVAWSSCSVQQTSKC